MENMDNSNSDVEEQKTCNLCGVIPENFIMLNCLHDICLQCIANNLSENEDKVGTSE